MLPVFKWRSVHLRPFMSVYVTKWMWQCSAITVRASAALCIILVLNDGPWNWVLFWKIRHCLSCRKYAVSFLYGPQQTPFFELRSFDDFILAQSTKLISSPPSHNCERAVAHNTLYFLMWYFNKYFNENKYIYYSTYTIARSRFTTYAKESL